MIKTIYSICRVALVTTLLFISGLTANAAKGDFGAWDLKTGHAGMKSGPLVFTEKSITIEFWLNLSEVTSSEKTAIMGTTNGDAGFLVSIRQNSANNNALDLRLFAKDANKNSVYFFIPRDTYIDKWVHVAFVISAEEEKTYLYLNGGYADEKSLTGGYYGNSALELAIAQWYSDPKPEGKMAEIRIWNIARTGDEIETNYNQRLTGKEEGLVLYYNFDNFDQVITNVANPDTNNGSLAPAATWNTVHAYETLAVIPTDVMLSGKTLTWSGSAENFEIEIVEAGSDDIVWADNVVGNSYSLADLELDADKTYYAKVRSKNSFFCSDWAISGSGSSIWNSTVDGFSIRSADNSIIINSDAPRNINVFAIDGRLIRSVELVEGENVVDNISKGIYLVENQKVIVR